MSDSFVLIKCIVYLNVFVMMLHADSLLIRPANVVNKTDGVCSGESKFQSQFNGVGRAYQLLDYRPLPVAPYYF